MNIINQPWNGRMFAHLNALLQRDPPFNKLAIAVAFAKRSGVTLVKQAMQAFVANGGSVEVIVGIDHKGTTRQGLEDLLHVTPQVYIFHDNRSDRTFHPKLYLFERPCQEAVAFVGSSNLTAGGLDWGYEVNYCFHLDLTNPSYAEFFDGYKHTFNRLFAEKPLLLDQGLLEYFIRHNMLPDEDTAALEPYLLSEKAVFPPIRIPPYPLPSNERFGLNSPYSTFAMTLSKDAITPGPPFKVTIPASAVDANPAFWFFPDFYWTSSSCSSVQECQLCSRFNFVSPPSFQTKVTRLIRSKSGSLRMIVDGWKCDLVSNDDLLVVEQTPIGTGYLLEMTFLLPHRSDYGRFLERLSATRRNSGNLWAYM